MTQGWLYYCVAKWSQFGVEWKRGPMKKLRELRPDLPDGFACFPVILLEEVAMVGAVEGARSLGLQHNRVDTVEKWL